MSASNMSASDSWQELTFKCNNSEDEASYLIELGALGVELVSGTIIRCWIPNLTCTQFIASAVNAGFTLANQKPSDSEQWLTKCAELWQAVTLGKFLIKPTPSVTDIENKNPNEIYIIPGTGFGTGHHATTQLATTLMQYLASNSPQFNRVLDLGTGSGILALIASRLWSCPIDAIEIDPLALSNAQDNVLINQAQDRINLLLGELEMSEQKYDLIVANIYAEVLGNLAQHFGSKARRQANLIVTGFSQQFSIDQDPASTSELLRSRSQTADAYVLEMLQAAGWSLTKRLESQGWVAFWLTRVQNNDGCSDF